MTHVLIVNQHGENRGDEAAMRAMLASFNTLLQDATFTLLYQFRDRNLRLEFSEDVQDLPIVLPVMDYLRAVLYTPLKAFGLDARWLLPKPIRVIIEAYERTDLVVSAPGGPYFGDMYIDHEIVHWWYIYLARLFNKPAFLYATSAGPFKNRWMNMVRRRLYPIFDRLVTREEVSARYIRALLGPSANVEVTADSAIQASFVPYIRDQYFTGERRRLADCFLAAVSLNDYQYPYSKDAGKCKENYNQAMIQLLSYLSKRVAAHYLFLPQLYGKVHNDVPYLRSMAERLPEGTSWEIVDPALNSDVQRRLFAMCDLYIATRYHPAIFASVAFVPGMCIYYEHKAQGFMKQLGLERYAFDINLVNGNELCVALEEILAHRKEIEDHLRKVVPFLQERSARTTGLAVDLLRQRPSLETGGHKVKCHC